MADKAHRLTDEKLEEMEKRLSAIYSRAGKEIGERWKEYLTESQAEIDELQKAYEIAKKGGDAKEIRKSGKKLANAKRERTLMNSRFKDLTETTAVHKHPHLHGTPWEMIDQHKRIRKKLSTMAPCRATETIRAVWLPEDEETCVIDVDIFARTCIQTAAKLHISVDGFCKLRRCAYKKLADAFNS